MLRPDGRTDGRTDGQEEFLVHWGENMRLAPERETERVRRVSHVTFCQSKEVSFAENEIFGLIRVEEVAIYLSFRSHSSSGLPNCRG